MAKVPNQRPAGGRGGSPRGNIKTFTAVGGRVPPPTGKNPVKGGLGCPLSVLAPAFAVAAVVLAACQLG